MPTIHHLFTSPGHNFYGHHGQPPGDYLIDEHDSVELVAGRGIVGDRFFDWKEDYKGQITFIDLEVIDVIREHSGNPELPASVFRRNVVTSGMDLNWFIAKQFLFNGVLLVGSEECSPCHWMDTACGKPGTEALMKGRGGLRCRILESGFLHRGPTHLQFPVV